MARRSVVIFPKFQNQSEIDQLRMRYDPLAEFIRPHITLVFPFESDIELLDLREHVAASVGGVGPFQLRLQGVTGAADGYLFLNVKRGNDEIIALHDRLYSGVLQQYLYRKVTYVPHITVGRVIDEKRFDQALRDTELFSAAFETTITEICMETIDPDERSRLEFCLPFATK